MTQVFISYAREDWEIAQKIYDDLKQNGVRPWMDKKDILIGQKWKIAIKQAITRSQYFLALLSTNSVSKRGYVQKELKLALDVLEEMPQTDIFILPILLEECEVIEERLKDLHWGELFSSYDACLGQVLRVVQPETPVEDNVVEAVREEVVTVKSPPADAPKPRYSLRKNSITVEFEKGQKTFKLNENWKPLEYIENEYKDNGNGTISDLATGLMWQQSGSEDYMTYENAKANIQKINKEKFAGYDDWRLPTVDELMSLVEPEGKNDGLFIDSIFDKTQRLCWTSDLSSAGSAWYVDFSYGEVLLDNVELYDFVRAVRS